MLRGRWQLMLDELIAALEGTGYSFAHFAWSEAPAGDYGTYAEDSGNDLMADGQHVESGIDGYINYFTRDDTGTPKLAIEAALNSLRIPWYLNTVQYENDTGYIHYEWGFSCYG